jgi:hypothetical protein
MSVRCVQGPRHPPRRFARDSPGPPARSPEHGRGVEGLAQVAGGSGLLDALEGRDVVVGRDEDDRDGQTILEVEPVHLSHLDVEHEAGRSIPRQPVEEPAGGRERLGLVTGRLHDAKERATDRRVVVHDRDDRYVLHDIVHTPTLGVRTSDRYWT